MSENISSSVLFHITRSMADLKSILQNGFFPHYCPEYTLEADDQAAANRRRPRAPKRAVPLVSFCDLPLSLIGKHLDNYGNYGIGLTKEWGLHYGVAPVIYIQENARTRLAKRNLAANVAYGLGRGLAEDLELLAAYTKPVSGPAWRNGRKDPKEVRFYDEREWRYVPDRVHPLILYWPEYANESRRNALHRRFKEQHALRIHPDDIQYLIIHTDSEILPLHKYLKALYTPKQAIEVTTAIMTVNCIREDA